MIDNRIDLSPTLVEQSPDNNTGLAHDTYPDKGNQARYDHMRSFLLGLLSQQSSFEEPIEKREGTPWFDLENESLKIWHAGEWHNYAALIKLGNTDLATWFDNISDVVQGTTGEISFSGSSISDGVTLVNIPESLRVHLTSTSRPIFYKNGVLIDPRNTRLEPSSLPTAIKLLSDELNEGDEFTVFIKHISDKTFYTQNVIVG